jgi:UMF1 family MFS transporter
LLVKENGKTIFLNLDPLFGFDPAEKEGTRFAGPFAALWCLVFSIPYFLWVREGHLPNRRPSIGGAMTTLWQAIKGVLNRPSQGKFLISSMFYRDALNGLYTFGGFMRALFWIGALFKLEPLESLPRFPQVCLVGWVVSWIIVSDPNPSFT